MITVLLIGILFMKSVNPQSTNLTVQYLESIINYETAEAFIYELPTNAYEYKPVNKRSTVYGHFDYIIVGGGSAGSVIATRLSEDPNLKILLLEAGNHENIFSDIPGMMLYLEGLRFNWNFETIPQTTCCLGMTDRKCPYPRGKVLGGTSVINGLIYARGNKHDYDTWERDGNRGWSFRHVLNFFIKSENSQIDGDPRYHGKGGLLNVEYYRPYSPVFYAFLDANVELGRKIVDYNGEYQLGVAGTQLNTLQGTRESTSRSFLKRAAGRINLKILTNSFVTKILITKRTKEAYGVSFSLDGKSYIAVSSKEVVVSAGAVSSPQLLMLSGIGPREHLRTHNIPVVRDLAVGRNLQDHATYRGLYFTSDYAEPVKSLSENIEDFLHNWGTFTVPANIQGVGFLQTNLTNTPGVPDIEVLLIPPNSTSDFTQKALHYTNQTYDAVWSKIDPTRSFTFAIVLLHPKSRGSIRLKSKSPYDYPLIDANYLSDQEGEDIETLYAGIQLVLEMVNTKAFRKMNAKPVYTPLPACKQYDYLSKAYWYCQIRQLTMNLYHPIGTCKMGPNPSRGAVVDYQLKVHGIRRLRVADGSIIPSALSGHPNAVAIVIGEKLAHMIKNNV